MKYLLTFSLLLAAALNAPAQKQLREATAAEMAAGTTRKAYVSPYLLARSLGPTNGVNATQATNIALTIAQSVVSTNSPSAVAAFTTGIVVTNGQVLSVPTNYFIPQGVTASIWFTNNGYMKVDGYGDISSNYLANGASVLINCRYYCPNGGQTLFNLRSNNWMSVTCSVFCVAADIDDVGRSQYAGLAAGEEGGNTTNQADYFLVDAKERINFYEWETKRYNTTEHLEYYAPVVDWKTRIFDCSFVTDQGGHVPTMNIAHGSKITADIFYVSYAASLSPPVTLQLWNNSPFTNIVVDFDIGQLLSTDANGGTGDPIGGSFTIGTNATQNAFNYSIASGIYLKRVTFDGDQLMPNGTGAGTLLQKFNGSIPVIGTFYNPVGGTNVTYY